MMIGPVSHLHDLPGDRFGPDDQVAALTFDDGPGSSTPSVLDQLVQLEVRATFFVVGSAAERTPERVAAVAAAGHTIAGHSWSHTRAEEMEDDQLVDETMRTAALIRDLTGQEATFVRPPHHKRDGTRYSSLLEPHGFTVVTWSIDPRDWATDDPVEVTRGVLDGLHPGGITVLHDGGGNRAATAAAIPSIVLGARLAGYQFVTL